jgi:hypothetical protein
MQILKTVDGADAPDRPMHTRRSLRRNITAAPLMAQCANECHRRDRARGAKCCRTAFKGGASSIRANHESPTIFCRPSQPSRDMAPMIRSCRISAYPAFETRPRRSLPPEECCRGTNSSHAAKSRSRLNCAMSRPNASRIRAVSVYKTCADSSADFYDDSKRWQPVPALCGLAILSGRQANSLHCLNCRR